MHLQAGVHREKVGRQLFALLGIVWVLTSMNCGSSPPSVSSQPASGKHVYLRRCASCHGLTGNGKRGNQPFAPDLTDPQGVMTKSDLILKNSILDGLEGPMGRMPAHRPILNAEELEAVIRYVRENLLSPQTTAPPP